MNRKQKVKMFMALMLALFVSAGSVGYLIGNYEPSTTSTDTEQGCMVFTEQKLIINGTMVQVTKVDACCCTKGQEVCACDGSGSLFFT